MSLRRNFSRICFDERRLAFCLFRVCGKSLCVPTLSSKRPGILTRSREHMSPSSSQVHEKIECLLIVFVNWRSRVVYIDPNRSRNAPLLLQPTRTFYCLFLRRVPCPAVRMASSWSTLAPALMHTFYVTTDRFIFLRRVCVGCSGVLVVPAPCSVFSTLSITAYTLLPLS